MFIVPFIEVRFVIFLKNEYWTGLDSLPIHIP